jgi:hypothetical protein
LATSSNSIAFHEKLAYAQAVENTTEGQTMSTDLFAIAKAIARQYEEERKARQRDREMEDESYADEARQEAYNRQECERIAREEGRPR